MALSCFSLRFLPLIRRKPRVEKIYNVEDEKQDVVVVSIERGSMLSESSESSAAELAAWHQIDAQYRNTFNEHGYYWWATSGYALAALLGYAGYTEAAQIRSLEFFARSVASRMGVANKPAAERWKSFMTDDHNPIELSWDWHTGLKAPQIRFSVEPVGLLAGMPEDPSNDLMSAEFTQMMRKDISAANLLWFNHFEIYFGLGMQQGSSLGHQSKIFWAFDLDEKDITSKVYFFPGYRAVATGKTNLEVISDAIKAAPLSTPEGLDALCMFEDFTREYSETTSSHLEIDMLAIDLVDPLKSRLKIYFRIRQTSFLSVRNAMTLGGRVANSDMEPGLRNLRQLWDRLFDQKGIPEDVSLPSTTHRTAGLLFNIEFRLGSKAPKVKIYIPVRHYARTDQQIMDAVTGYMSLAKWSSGDGVNATPAVKGPSPSAYGDAMDSVFGRESLGRDRGRQTYVGCSIQPTGLLRVVSYVNPRGVNYTDRKI